MAADDAPDQFSSAANARLQRIKDALMAEIVQRLQRLNQSDGKLSSEAAALDNARTIRRQVMDLMEEAGAPTVESVGEAAVMDAVSAALAQHAPAPSVDNGGMIGFSTAPDAKQQIAMSVQGVLDQITGVFADGAQAMRKAIDVGLNTGSDLQSVITDVAQALETTFDRATTATDTAIRGAMRMALVMQAERGAEAAGITMLYLYLGPDDGKTRPFCEEHVNRVYSLDALKAMDNGTDLPVEIFAGGYSCRHALSPIDEESARAEGYTVILE